MRDDFNRYLTIMALCFLIAWIIFTLIPPSCKGQELAGHYSEAARAACRPDSTYWQTVEVLNKGNLTDERTLDFRCCVPVPCPDNNPTCCVAHFKTVHSWVYGEEYDSTTWTPVPQYFEDLKMYYAPEIGTTKTYRNRICRNCLRHERQVERVYVLPVKTSEYDSLLNLLEKR